jgi:hypothetical protein
VPGAHHASGIFAFRVQSVTDRRPPKPRIDIIELFPASLWLPKLPQRNARERPRRRARGLGVFLVGCGREGNSPAARQLRARGIRSSIDVKDPTWLKDLFPYRRFKPRQGEYRLDDQRGSVIAGTRPIGNNAERTQLCIYKSSR